MNTIFFRTGLIGLVLILPIAVGAAKAGAQLGANERPNDLAGDGIPNAEQDEEFGGYGQGDSPNELSGDGIPNAAQDESLGRYGGNQETSGQQTQEQERVRSLADLEKVMQQDRLRIREDVKGTDNTAQAIRGDREPAEIAVRAMQAGRSLLGTAEAEQRMLKLSQMVSEAHDDALKAETKTRNRSAFKKFFAGGDKESADELEQAAERSRVATQEMKQLLENCDSCDETTRDMLREQVRAMEEEQGRVTGVAERERERKGFFGFLFGWMT